MSENERKSEEDTFTEEELAMLDKLAENVVARHLTAPAIFFLEVSKPLNFLGSQFLLFFEPIIQAIFTAKHYTMFREMLERRETIEMLLVRIEALDAERRKKEKEAKQAKKNKKRKEQQRAD